MSREERILDAAAELIVHYGYDKTTVSDIARKAGVSKGAIYLGFASKDDLFEALILRELRRYAESWLARVEADSQGGTIGGFYKNMLYAMEDSPFMAAMFKKDRHTFGNYLLKPHNVFSRSNTTPRHEVVKLLQQAGAIRSDIDPRIIAHIMNMLMYGLVAMPHLTDDPPPTDEVIETIALIMDQALTPEGGANSEQGKAIIQQIADAAHQQSKD